MEAEAPPRAGPRRGPPWHRAARLPWGTRASLFPPGSFRVFEPREVQEGLFHHKMQSSHKEWTEVATTNLGDHLMRPVGPGERGRSLLALRGRCSRDRWRSPENWCLVCWGGKLVSRTAVSTGGPRRLRISHAPCPQRNSVGMAEAQGSDHRARPTGPRGGGERPACSEHAPSLPALAPARPGPRGPRGGCGEWRCEPDSWRRGCEGGLGPGTWLPAHLCSSPGTR